VPDVETISARFHERRTERTPFERSMLRLTGMDLKMEQYRKGEQFVRAIAARAGPRPCAALGRPETLPRDGEIDAPDRWIARVLDGTARPRVTDRSSGEPARARAGRRPDGHRAQPDPVGALPVARPRAHPRRRAGRPDRDRLGRGLADGPLDDVEVMLRGWLSSDAFDRILARAPRLSWVHSATSGVERALTPSALERGVVVTNARGVFSRPIAEYVLMMILAVSRGCRSCSSSSASGPGSRSRAELRDVTVGIVGLGSIGRAVGRARDGVRLPRRGRPPSRRGGLDRQRPGRRGAARSAS
jgi:hypothetical protein